MQLCTAVDETLHAAVGLQTPHFVEHWLPKLVDLVRASRQLPVGEEYAIRRGSREFLAATRDLGQASLAAAHRILSFLDPGARSGRGGEDLASYDALVGSIDDVLERVDSCLQDALAGRAASGADAEAAESAARPSDGGSKPQLRWRHLVDNERTCFVPRLPIKHNLQVPLAPEILHAQRRAGLFGVADADPSLADVDLEGEWHTAPLPHPYEAELNGFMWPDTYFDLVKPELYPRMEDTPFVVVSTAEALREMIAEIKATCSGGEIAVDVEHHELRSFRGFVCLVQISSRHKDWVVDPFDIFEEMHALNEIFSDPGIVKVLHGADRDVEWLQRDFSVYLVNMFDTGIATRVLRLQGGFSLANLVSLFCGEKLQKQYQTADWRERPLPEEMLQYARCDTHYLLYCYDRLRNALLGSTGAHGSIVEIADGSEAATVTEFGVQALQTALERSTELCRKQYVEAPFDAAAEAARLCSRFGSKGRPLEPRKFRALQLLASWRDRLARSLDESCNYVAPDAVLWRIALALPATVMRLRSSCNPLPWILQERAKEVVELVSSSADVPEGRGQAAVQSAASSALATPSRRPHAIIGKLASSAAAPEGAGAVGSPPPREWPTRSCGAPRPIVHVSVTADRHSPAARAAPAVAADARSPAAASRLGADAARLRSIHEAMTFLAAPPEPPSVVEAVVDVEVGFAGGAHPELVRVIAGAEEERPELQRLAVRRKRKRRGPGGAVGGSCLEDFVKAASVVACAAAAPDVLAQPLGAPAESAADGREPPAKKRKVKKRSVKPTMVDPYM